MPHLINLANADVESDYNLEGYDVYDSSGQKMGDVDSLIADGDTMELRYLVVDAGGWFSSKQFVVPAGDVARIDDDERRVHFKTLSRQTLESGQYPRYDESWWDENDHESFGTHERQVARAYQPDRQEHQEVDYSENLYRRPAEGAQRLQLLEERLRVNKEQYQAGQVRLGKRMVEHTETVNVPVREERVIIERTAGSGRVTAGDLEVGDNETVEVSVMRERVNVEKETVVAEEVNVRTEAVERQEQVSETVRREELEVEDSSGLVTERSQSRTAGDQPHGGHGERRG